MDTKDCKSFDTMYGFGLSDTGITGVQMLMADANIVGGLHGPRIRISNQLGQFNINDYYALSVSNNPEVEYGVPTLNPEIQQQVIDWVNLNCDTLMGLWHDTYEDTIDFYLDLKRIDGIISPSKLEIMESRKQHNG